MGEGVCVVKFDTVRRLVFSAAVFLLLAEAAAAQSVLNFSRTILDPGSPGTISVLNPTPYWADVQFTLYGMDGVPVASGTVNPVNYRVAPKGRLSMALTGMFAGPNITGWVQATSSTSGLRGFYFTGNAQTDIDGGEGRPCT